MNKLSSSNWLAWVPINFYMNVLYCFGASLMDSFVVYPGWTVLPQKEFMLLHTAQSPWIINTLVIPLAVATVLNLLILWVKPAIIPQKLIVISLLCMFVNWLMSALIQIPAHNVLLKHYDASLLQQLIKTNYLRVGIQIFQLILVYRMLSLTMKAQQS